jgi:hypothetical protein
MSEDERDEVKEAREVALQAKRDELKVINDKRTGKGSRLSAGLTRGKNPQIVVFEEFDESQPETLPITVAEFLELTKIDSEPVYLSMLIDGYNLQQRTNASDPIAEHVNPAWSEVQQKQFKMAVKNYTAAMQASNPAYTLDEAVSLLKPSLEAGFALSQQK